jgi:Tol biopolymer transport system component/DNA-binding winged helix-turn-helix (wHTH) protein
MSRASIGLYEFGPFRLDLERRAFTREHQVVPLAPKTFDLLVLLVQSPGRAFSKQELMNALWPDTFVEEANLSFQISVLRKALGEDGARCVETVPKHGYRFGAEVRATMPSAEVSAESVSSAKNEPSSVMPGRGTKRAWLAGATVTAVSLVVVTFLTVVREPRTSAVRTSLAVPLTAYPGYERAPSLSPDGSRVAFSWNGPTLDNYDIYVKLAGPGEPVRLTRSPAPDDWPAWSPDGRFIAFVRFASPPAAADLVVIPALGGAEKTIATIFPAPIPRDIRPIANLSWTPDGRWLAFGGATSPNGSRGIWLIAVDGSEQRRLTEAPGGSDVSPVVSPDGRHLAFLRVRTVGRVAIFLVPLTSGLAPIGTPRQLTDDDPGVIGLAWTPNGRDLVFSSSGHLGASRMAKISEVSQSSRTREPEFLPFGERATAISIAGTGRLVYSAQSRDTALYELALLRSARPPVTPVALAAFSSTFDEQTPHYSPDGQRLAFASTRSGAEEIWIANRDGSNPLQVTSVGGPSCSNPQWSPNGRTLLFSSRRAGAADLYLLQPDTGKLTQLTKDPTDENEARWSRDGRWIYFASNRTGRVEVWRMPAAGGAPAQITWQGGAAAVESGDGFLYYAKEQTSPSSIWRVPVNSGAEVHVVDGLSYSINFAVGERGLYFVAVGDTDNKPSVDFFDFATGKRSTLVRLDKPHWFGMTLSPDERSLVFSLVDSAGSNVMLVDRFQ